MSVDRNTGFEELYRKYSSDVYRFAVYLSRDPATAEDITAETFLRVWTSPAPVRSLTVKAYLLTIARNLWIEMQRRQKREAPVTGEPAAAMRHDDVLDAQRKLAEVSERLAEMPEVEREALLLRANHDLSYAEIGWMLGLSEQAARVKVFRARVKLKETP